MTNPFVKIYLEQDVPDAVDPSTTIPAGRYKYRVFTISDGVTYGYIRELVMYICFTLHNFLSFVCKQQQEPTTAALPSGPPTQAVATLPVRRAALPSLSLAPRHSRFATSSNPCPICLIHDDNLHYLIRCEHPVHLRCLGQWIEASARPTCPLCRAEVHVSDTRMARSMYRVGRRASRRRSHRIAL